jgi:hypothetical protein
MVTVKLINLGPILLYGFSIEFCRKKSRLRNASLRFPRDGGYLLSPQRLLVGCSENVLPLFRKFCSAPAEGLPNNKVNGEFPKQDAADMSHFDSETSHGDGTVGAIRKGLKKQGPKNDLGTKAGISVPRAAHYHEKEFPGRVQPYLFQIVLDTSRNFLVNVLDKWNQDGNRLERSEVLLVLFHLRKQRLYSKALQVLLCQLCFLTTGLQGCIILSIHFNTACFKFTAGGKSSSLYSSAFSLDYFFVLFFNDHIKLNYLAVAVWHLLF